MLRHPGGRVEVNQIVNIICFSSEMQLWILKLKNNVFTDEIHQRERSEVNAAKSKDAWGVVGSYSGNILWDAYSLNTFDSISQRQGILIVEYNYISEVLPHILSHCMTTGILRDCLVDTSVLPGPCTLLGTWEAPTTCWLKKFQRTERCSKWQAQNFHEGQEWSSSWKGATWSSLFAN